MFLCFNDVSFKAIFSPQPGKFDKDLIFEKAIEKEIDDINFVPVINGLNLEDESGMIYMSYHCDY
jgi:hypothetical protein